MQHTLDQVGKKTFSVHVGLTICFISTKKAIQEFMAFFQDTYPEATVPIKMHLLEDHTLQWGYTNHVGFGLLGEQGAEPIHAKFNRLGLAFAPIKDRMQNLMCIVKEHLLSIEPQLVAAIPPPAKNTIAM